MPLVDKWRYIDGKAFPMTEGSEIIDHVGMYDSELYIEQSVQTGVRTYGERSYPSMLRFKVWLGKDATPELTAEVHKKIADGYGFDLSKIVNQPKYEKKQWGNKGSAATEAKTEDVPF